MMLDSVIIGAGPAGITAAVYAKRYNLHFEIVDKELITGGKVNYPHWIENFIGFPEGIKGSSLAEVFQKHLQVLNISSIQAKCENIVSSQEGFEVILSKGPSLLTKTVLVASGTVERRIGIPGEEQYMGKGVSTCATCDAPFFKGKTIAVIGGGDSALSETLYLAEFASKIILIHRRNEFRGAPSLISAIESNSAITVYKGTIPLSIQGEDFVKSVTIQHLDSKQQEELLVNGVFIFSGYEPKTDFISVPVDLDEQGFIKTDENMMTSHSGLFAAGDIRSKSLRQIVTATSDGAIAIHQIRNRLYA